MAHSIDGRGIFLYNAQHITDAVIVPFDLSHKEFQMNIHFLSVSTSALEALTEAQLFEIIIEAWGEDVVIVTPTIPLDSYGAPFDSFRRVANSQSYDMIVQVHETSSAPSDMRELWDLGWDDGDRIFIHIFPSEFFEGVDGYDLSSILEL